MSHAIIIESLEFATARVPEGVIHVHRIVELLVTHRQLLNSLAPILPRKQRLIPIWPERFFQLLMRADTFRFATALHVGDTMTSALTKVVLSKLDFVVDVDMWSRDLDDTLTPTLLALPHLERLSVFHCEPMTYNGTLRPLLKHPRESVRRSVATSRGNIWFFPLSTSTEQYISLFLDDIIPLIDSASCSAAICDYISLAHAACCGWWQLPRDLIMMLGERMFEFFCSPNDADLALIDRALYSLGLLASAAIRRNSDGPALPDVVLVDVFKEWPVIELLPDVIRRGLPMTEDSGVWEVIGTVFRIPASAAIMKQYQQRFFELQIPDVMYDSYFAATGRSPLDDDVRSCFSKICEADHVAVLTRTTVFHKELRNFSVPWHREVMAKSILLWRRGLSFDDDADGETLVLHPGKDEFFRRTAGIYFIVGDFLASLWQQHMRPRRPGETSDVDFPRVVALLFDEEAGLNIGPIRSYFFVRKLMLSFYDDVSPCSHREDRTIEESDEGIVIRLLTLCARAAQTERYERSRRKERRRSRTDSGDDGALIRYYLSEFWDSLSSICS